MKRIPPMVYEGLSPKQRLIAYFEALARNDEDERDHLLRSCHRLTYTQPDARFLDSMERIMCLAMTVEADLKEALLRYLISIQFEIDSSPEHLQDFADCREAWEMTLDALKIDKEVMALAGPPKSPVFVLCEVLFPKPKSEKAKALSATMLNCIGKGLDSDEVSG